MHARTVRAGACVRARMRLLAGGGGGGTQQVVFSSSFSATFLLYLPWPNAADHRSQS